MCKRMEIGREFRAATVACVAFWKVCQYSQRYSNQFKLEELCKSHEELYGDATFERAKIERYFDIGTQNVKKVFKDFFEKDLMSKYLPRW
jgi:hypothetical protein